jgi:hypothetical protein
MSELHRYVRNQRLRQSSQLKMFLLPRSPLSQAHAASRPVPPVRGFVLGELHRQRNRQLRPLLTATVQDAPLVSGRVPQVHGSVLPGLLR